jgi:hypothetical protein
MLVLVRALAVLALLLLPVTGTAQLAGHSVPGQALQDPPASLPHATETGALQASAECCEQSGHGHAPGCPAWILGLPAAPILSPAFAPRGRAALPPEIPTSGVTPATPREPPRPGRSARARGA